MHDLQPKYVCYDADLERKGSGQTLCGPDRNDASVSQKLSGIYPKFDLDKSYTALRMNVKGDFVSVLPVPSLSRNSVWKANRVMYRGY